MAETSSILIIDDTPANLGAMVEALEQRGYRVLVAQDGEEGIERARLVRPDLILLDVLMPGLDGFETCRRLKANPDLDEIPVVFMTALSQMSDKVTGFGVGGVDYVTKPFQIDEVLARVATHIKLRALQKQLEVQNAELRHYRDGLEQQVTARTEEVRLMSHALNRVQEAAYLVDQDARIIYVNDEACRSLGYSGAELTTMRVMDVDQNMNEQAWAGHWQTVKRDRSAILESSHRRSDGSTFPIEVNTSYFEYGGRAYNLALVRDITERRRAEDALRHLNRALRAISNCNQALVRADDEGVLLKEICRIICEEAGYRMAWVAYAERDAACSVRPLAWAGAEDGYLSLPGLTWADTAADNRPLGVAIRGGETATMQDLALASAPWCQEAIRRDYRSSIALPLKDDRATTFGALCIYSAQANAFTMDEIALLEELSGDLAFGITALRTRAERGRAEARLAANEQRYRMVFENSPVSIWEEDFSAVKALLDSLRRDGVDDIGRHLDQYPETVQRCADAVRIVDVNKAALALHGTTSKEQLLTSLTDTFTPESFRTFREELICLWNGATEMVRPAAVKTLAGEPRNVVVYFSVCPGYEEDYGRILVSLVDITERMRAEEALAQQWRHLEELVATRTRELAEARDAAEAANRAKSVFLANMSHELRTPLNAILGFAQIMATDKRLPEDQQHNVKVINHSGRHLLALINDVLEISRIEAGRLQLQTTAFDLADLLSGILEMFEARLAEKGLTLRLSSVADLPRFLLADAGKLRQILMNLLSNAVKFTRQGGVELNVGIDTGNRQKPMLVFTVHDTGVGIVASELEAIFRPFYQTEQGTRASEGTGLGLTIARQYARLMGGELTAASEPGKGSTFTLSLPATFAAEATLPTPSLRHVVGLADGQPSRRVLIVEDAPDNQRLLEQLMRRLGFETRVADNGERALEAFESWRPDFIWMDMRMPVMDGYEATRRIRASPDGRLVKIAALTASAFQEDRDAIFAAGCDDVLSKPLDEDHLFAAMARLLGLRFRYDEAAGQAQVPDVADLSGLAAGQVAELIRAAAQLDVEATTQAIERIRGADAELADRLAALARAFRFDSIIALSEQTERKP